MTQATAHPNRRPYLIIEPPRGWNPLNLRELWQYREMVYRMVMRDIKARYKQSALGPFWIIVMPLISAGVTSVIFGGIAGMQAGTNAWGVSIPYPLFVYAGMLIWETYTRSFSATANCLRSQAGILTKVYYPRLIAPITGIAGGLLDLLIGLVVLTLMVAATGVYPTAALLALPLFILAAWMVGLAMGLWIASLSIRFRDLGRAGGFINTILMWGTPTMWAAQELFRGDRIPESWQAWRPALETLVQLNPLYHVVEGFRWATLGYTEWRLSSLTLVSLALTAALFVAGLFFFRRIDANVADTI